MSYKEFGLRIDSVVTLLKLERDPRARSKADSYNVKCPFCDTPGRKYHMNINTKKNVYFCPRCMDSSTCNTGALDLYGRVRLGTPLTPGVNGKELYEKLCLELGANDVDQRQCLTDRQKSEEILPAEDVALDCAYRALLALPYLSLSKQHKENLLKRGLDQEAIATGMYATLRKSVAVLKVHPGAAEIAKWCSSHEADIVQSVSTVQKKYSKSDLMTGFLIAEDLLAQGVSLHRVPGFFTIAGKWCFRYMQGMLIPTFTCDGLIVGLQVRRDSVPRDGLRYLTVSSKGFDDGVTTGIARTHIAKTGPIDESTAVFLTEGPLKANVILHLLKTQFEGSIAIVALQGVMSTGKLPKLAAYLYEQGIRTVFNALDMDKCTNISVANAGKAMKTIFREHGIRLAGLYWDKEYAQTEFAELASKCVQHDYPVPETVSVFDGVLRMASNLHSQRIEYDVYEVKGVKSIKHWRDETKGLDDYLNYLFQKARSS